MIAREHLISMVQATQRGDDEAAAELYDIFYSDIYYHIMKTVKDPELAADLTQDTFIEILGTIGKLEEPAAFVTWAKQIAYHRCTAYFRKSHELLVDEDEDGYSVFDTVEEDRDEFIPGEALEQEDLKKAIHDIIDSLPAEQRSALLMRYFEEISVKEIAQIQGVSEGTVKSRLNYARKAVKQSVEDYEKKHDIKLHSVGILPLLLWLFRQYRQSGSTFGAVGSVGAAGAAATGGGALAAKIVAAVAAVALVAGGITAVVKNLPSPEPEPQVTTPVAEYPRLWAGYEHYDGFFTPARYEILVTEKTESTISGHLQISKIYDISYETDFTGNGLENPDGTITYTAELATAYAPLPSFPYSQVELVYNPETESITIGRPFEEVVLPEDAKVPTVLARDVKWSGIGKDDMCVYSHLIENHLFEVYVQELTDSAITGRLVVSKDGVVEHDTAFTGRGFWENDVCWYEVAVEQPRTTEFAGTHTVDYFGMTYNTQTDVLEIKGYYQVKTSREIENS